MPRCHHSNQFLRRQLRFGMQFMHPGSNIQLVIWFPVLKILIAQNSSLTWNSSSTSAWTTSIHLGTMVFTGKNMLIFKSLPNYFLNRSIAQLCAKLNRIWNNYPHHFSELYRISWINCFCREFDFRQLKVIVSQRISMKTSTKKFWT